MPDRSLLFTKVQVDQSLQVGGDGFDLACSPRRSGDEARGAREGDPEDVLIRACRWPLHANGCLQASDACCDLDQVHAHDVELDGAPDGSSRHCSAQTSN